MRHRLFLSALAALIAFSTISASEPPLPTIPNRTFTITQFGAKGDGKTVNTNAIQATIDACAKAGGGTVSLPRGDFLCGPIQLANNIALRIEAGAILRILPLAQYPGGSKTPANFISGKDLHDIAIGGSGTIEGQGKDWWPLASDKSAKRPIMISLSHCDRVLIENVTLQNSPMFHIGIGGKSSNVTVRGVTIHAPPSNDPVTPGHNTDACDVTGQHILVRDCNVSVGDDDFTCGGGTSDVLITHCTYGNGHGVSIGSGTKGGVSNFTVSDCTFKGTECGVRIKSDRDRGGVVSNITYKNLRMTNVGIPILIYGTYLAPQPEFHDLQKLTPETAATYPAAALTELTPVYRDITLSDITATVQSGHRAGLIWGLPEAPASNVVLRNVNITADRPFGIYNAKGVRMENCKIKTPAGVKPIVTTRAEGEGFPR